LALLLLPLPHQPTPTLFPYTTLFRSQYIQENRRGDLTGRREPCERYRDGFECKVSLAYRDRAGPFSSVCANIIAAPPRSKFRWAMLHLHLRLFLLPGYSLLDGWFLLRRGGCIQDLRCVIFCIDLIDNALDDALFIDNERLAGCAHVLAAV